MGNDNEQGNERWRMNARLTIYAMAGFYLLTLAYQMLKTISESNNKGVIIVFAVLFIVAGIGMMSLGLIHAWRSAKEMKQTMETIEENEEMTESVEAIEENCEDSEEEE